MYLKYQRKDLNTATVFIITKTITRFYLFIYPNDLTNVYYLCRFKRLQSLVYVYNIVFNLLYGMIRNLRMILFSEKDLRVRLSAIRSIAQYFAIFLQ